MDSRIIDWYLKSVFKAYNNWRYAGLARVLRAKYGQLCRQFCSEDGKVGIEMLNTSLLVPMAIYCYIKVIQNSGATHCGFERAWFECVWISFGESYLHIHNTKSRKPPPIDSDHVFEFFETEGGGSYSIQKLINRVFLGGIFVFFSGKNAR